MHSAILVTVSALAALGLGGFCVDFYRNRRRQSAPTSKANIDFVFDSTVIPDGTDLHQVGHVVSDLSHGVGEASHSVAEGLGQCVEVISHGVSHH
jgi:hypothetical protein